MVSLDGAVEAFLSRRLDPDHVSLGNSDRVVALEQATYRATPTTGGPGWSVKLGSHPGTASCCAE